MGRDTEFPFGANQGSIADELAPCMSFLVCPRCRKGHGYCSETAAVLRVAKEKGFEFFQESNSEQRKTGMKVGQFATAGSGERNPLIEPKHIGASAKVKILSANPITTPKFHGLILNVKLGEKKFAKLVSFDPTRAIDLGNIIGQLGSDDTDDWIGQQLVLVTKKGSKGGKFVNIAPGKRGK